MYCMELLPSPSPLWKWKSHHKQPCPRDKTGNQRLLQGPGSNWGPPGTPQSLAALVLHSGSQFQGGLPQGWPLAPCSATASGCRTPGWGLSTSSLKLYLKKKIKISQQLSRNISHLTPQNKNALAFTLFFVKNNKNKTNVLLWEVIFLPPSFTKSSQGQGGKRRVPSPGDLPSPLHAGVSHAWCQGHAYLLTHPEAWAMSAANERGLGNFITTS